MESGNCDRRIITLNIVVFHCWLLNNYVNYNLVYRVVVKKLMTMKLEISDSQSNHSDFSSDSQSSQGSSTNDFISSVPTSRATLSVSLQDILHNTYSKFKPTFEFGIPLWKVWLDGSFDDLVCSSFLLSTKFTYSAVIENYYNNAYTKLVYVKIKTCLAF